MIKFDGIGISAHIACGKIKLFDSLRKSVTNDGKTVEYSECDELQKYALAKEKLECRFSELEASSASESSEISSDILSFYHLMLNDDDFDAEIQRNISAKKMSAVGAVEAASEKFSDIFKNLPNEYMRERISDLMSLKDQLVQILNGGNQEIDISSPVIIVAGDLSPVDTLLLRNKNVIGFALESGSTNSHTAILARSMDIPAVFSLGELPKEIDGRNAIIDGKRGTLIIDPDEKTLENIRQEIAEAKTRVELYEKQRGRTSMTKSGKKIQLFANVGDLDDIALAISGDAEGIGLFRSEFMYMNRNALPTEEDQFGLYRRAITEMNGREVIIRTLDIGSDKQLPYFKLDNERNPALGLRGIRVGLKHKQLLITQLRAILRAGEYGNVSVMLPMISVQSELDEARTIFEETKRQLSSEGVNCSTVRLGIMIETPAAALISDKLSDKADFFSVGTNDLTQYTLAADRENGALYDIAGGFPESVKYLVSLTVKNAKKRGIPVSVCGEAAGSAENLEFFLTLGVDKLSVSPSSVLRTRHAISQLN